MSALDDLIAERDALEAERDVLLQRATEAKNALQEIEPFIDRDLRVERDVLEAALREVGDLLERYADGNNIYVTLGLIGKIVFPALAGVTDTRDE